MERELLERFHSMSHPRCVLLSNCCKVFIPGVSAHRQLSSILSRCDAKLGLALASRGPVSAALPVRHLSKVPPNARTPVIEDIDSIGSNTKPEPVRASLDSSPRIVAEDNETSAPKKESYLFVKFSQPLASRRDLDRFINDIPVGMVDAVLTPNLFAFGRWIVRVDDQAAAKLMKRASDDVFGRVAIDRITSYDYVKMSTAHKVKIFNSSIRVQGHSPRMGRPELQYLFEDFGVTHKDIHLLEIENPSQQDKKKTQQQQSPPHTFSGDWFVKFPSSELARSAYHQRDGSIVRGHKLVLTLYDI